MRLEYNHRESQPGESSTTAAYATAGKKAKKASMVLAVSDLDKAARIR